MTFVILSGGIDLSVGSVVALTTMVSAALVEHMHWSRVAVIPLVLAMGTVFGAVHGRADPLLPVAAVHRDAGRHVPRSRPVLSDHIDSITITDPTFQTISQRSHPDIGIGARSPSAR